MRRISLFLFSISFAILAYFCLETWRFERLPLVKKFEEKWAEDLDELAQTKKLPKGWSHIREVELSAGNDEARELLKKIQIPISLQKKGRYKLLILMVAWEEGPKTGAFIQYDLEDTESANSNTVWELNRSIVADDQGLWYKPYLKMRSRSALGPR